MINARRVFEHAAFPKGPDHNMAANPGSVVLAATTTPDVVPVAVKSGFVFTRLKLSFKDRLPSSHFSLKCIPLFQVCLD